MKELIQTIEVNHRDEFKYVQTESGRIVPVWLPERGKKIIYDNDYSAFKPSGFVEVDGWWRPITFKVVTEQRKSLGLRKNPNIMIFPPEEWVCLDDEEILPGSFDRGGIWSALKFSATRTLTSYMTNQYQQRVRTFMIAIDNPLFANCYRVKSQGVYFLKEVTGLNSFREILI